MASWFTIQEVSRRTRLSEPTIRYYEKIGLIGVVARDDSSGHRRFTTQTVETIESLACLRAAGMRVEDMRRYLALLGQGNAAAAEQRDLFTQHARRLAGEIEQLKLRLEYLERKSEMWDARARGDDAAELRAIESVIRIARKF